MRVSFEGKSQLVRWLGQTGCAGSRIVPSTELERGECAKKSIELFSGTCNGINQLDTGLSDPNPLMRILSKSSDGMDRVQDNLKMFIHEIF